MVDILILCPSHRDNCIVSEKCPGWNKRNQLSITSPAAMITNKLTNTIFSWFNLENKDFHFPSPNFIVYYRTTCILTRFHKSIKYRRLSRTNSIPKSFNIYGIRIEICSCSPHCICPSDIFLFRITDLVKIPLNVQPYHLSWHYSMYPYK